MLSQPHSQLALDPVTSSPSAYEDAIVPDDDLNRASNRHREEEEEIESFVRTDTEIEEEGEDGSPRSALEAYSERLVSS